MTWLDRKKIAFIPVQRTNANPPDEPVPTDWPAAVLQRVFFDPIGGTGPDRSSRAYIQAASSDALTFDAAVMPVHVFNQPDVPTDSLEGQMGAQLRSSGFQAAALVMLGQPPTGQGQRGGFWARFDMSEGVGVWAMELMHCLTGFDDLYAFGGNMGPYDAMAGAVGTHPSAYTKSAVGWLDSSAIAMHLGRVASYQLHSIGLTQPPPSGRIVYRCKRRIRSVTSRGEPHPSSC